MNASDFSPISDPLFASPVLKVPEAASVVGAVVVLYEPDLEITRQLLQILQGQVHQVCVVDNSPHPEAALAELLNTFEVHYLPLGRNCGIAHAQNMGVTYLLSQGVLAILLLDQDSLIPDDYVERLWLHHAALQRSGVRLAAIGPSYVDRKSGRRSRAIRYRWWGGIEREAYASSAGPIAVDYVIASGSLIDAQAWREVGGMHKDLFVYWVDVEWGLRAQAKGFQSYLIPAIEISHSVGQKMVHIGPKTFAWHDDFRQYFILRNPWLMLRQGYLPWMMRCMTVLSLFVKYMPAYWVASDHKRATLTTFYWALRDGFLNRGGPHPQAREVHHVAC